MEKEVNGGADIAAEGEILGCIVFCKIQAKNKPQQVNMLSMFLDYLDAQEISRQNNLKLERHAE